METDDGVKRKGKDYRTGYVEALEAFREKLKTHANGAKKKSAQGLEEADALALILLTSMRAQLAEAKATAK